MSRTVDRILRPSLMALAIGLAAAAEQLLVELEVFRRGELHLQRHGDLRRLAAELLRRGSHAQRRQVEAGYHAAQDSAGGHACGRWTALGRRARALARSCWGRRAPCDASQQSARCRSPR